MFRFGFRNKSSDRFDLVRSNRFEGNSGRDQHKSTETWKERNRSHLLPSHPIPSHPSAKHKASTCTVILSTSTRVHRVYGSRSREMGDLKRHTNHGAIDAVFLFPLSQHVRFIQITRRLLHWLYGRNAASAESSSSSESTLIPRTSWSQLVPSAFLLLSYPPWMGYQQKT